MPAIRGQWPWQHRRCLSRVVVRAPLPLFVAVLPALPPPSLPPSTVRHPSRPAPVTPCPPFSAPMSISAVGRNRGFTLVEVMVVVLILGLMAGIMLPRLMRPLFASDIRLATRRLASLTALVRDRAVRTHRTYRLHYDREKETLWVTYIAPNGEERKDEGSLTSKQRWPGKVDLVEMRTQFQGRRPQGSDENLFTTFLPNGYVERTLLHVQAEEAKYTLVIEPLTGRVRRLDGFLEEIPVGTR